MISDELIPVTPMSSPSRGFHHLEPVYDTKQIKEKMFTIKLKGFDVNKGYWVKENHESPIIYLEENPNEFDRLSKFVPDEMEIIFKEPNLEELNKSAHYGIDAEAEILKILQEELSKELNESYLINSPVNEAHNKVTQIVNERLTEYKNSNLIHDFICERNQLNDTHINFKIRTKNTLKFLDLTINLNT